MGNFAIIRLGKTSVSDIKTIDKLRASPSSPLALKVTCSQVPQELAVGDFAFFCLGSDNNGGIPTSWVRGLRAFGRITSKKGGATYNDQSVIGVEVGVVLPESVTKRDFLAKAPTAYYWFSDIPVMGVDAHSNQTIQMIKKEEPEQNVPALLYALTELFPSFKADAVRAYPQVEPLFGYIPTLPTGEVISGAPSAAAVITSTFATLDLGGIVDAFITDAEECFLRIHRAQALQFIASLLSKRFLIATGLAGSGKTKLSQALTSWLSPHSIASDPFAEAKTIEGETITYFVHSADRASVEFWNSKDEADTVKVSLPREMIEEWASYITENGLKRNTPARVIREGVKANSKFSSQLHSFETHLKAAAFALIEHRSASTQASCVEIVPVGADWTSNEHVFGYPNGLDKREYVGMPALKLLLRATAAPHVPHFLILDEMNLSHVERYFSDVLSAVESDEKIHLHSDDERICAGLTVPQSVPLPKNLFIIGTVNVDETTYMFSPKVLDRANVIEFRMTPSEMASYLENPQKPDLVKLAARGHGFGKAFVAAAVSAIDELPAKVKRQFDAELMLFFNVMSGNGTEFGYRVAHESSRFVQFFMKLGDHSEDERAWLADAFDYVILQKFLPKLHGSRSRLGPLLKKLWFLCTADLAARGPDTLTQAETAANSNGKGAEPALEVPEHAPYPHSAVKISRMWRLLNENGFASFAEA